MNTGTGARLMVEAARLWKIRIPEAMEVFSAWELPNSIDNIIKNAEWWISLCFSINQWLENGSLDEYRIMKLWKSDQTISKKNIKENLYPQSVSTHWIHTKEMASNKEEELLRELSHSGPWENFYFHLIDFPKNINGVLYKSRNTTQVDFTFFAQVQKNEYGNDIFIQWDEKNPDWRTVDFKTNMVYRNGKLEILKDNLEIPESIVKKTLEMIKNMYDYAATQKDSDQFIFEGKIMNKQYYNSPWPIIIDCYRGFPNPDYKSLDHRNLIKESENYRKKENGWWEYFL